jgi:hypothetical protein
MEGAAVFPRAARRSSPERIAGGVPAHSTPILCVSVPVWFAFFFAFRMSAFPHPLRRR